MTVLICQPTFPSISIPPSDRPARMRRAALSLEGPEEDAAPRTPPPPGTAEPAVITKGILRLFGLLQKLFTLFTPSYLHDGR